MAALAARQRGIVTTRELLECGLSRRTIGRWVRDGHLHPKHRGVFAVGHREITTEARWLAAVKACGPRAALSGYAAAALWGLVEWDGRPPEVTIPDTSRRKHPGIRIHRTSKPECTLYKNIPVTPIARTLDDLAPSLAFKPLRRAVRQAFNLGLITTGELARARSKRLRSIAAGLVPTRTILEDLVHDLILQAGFEEPLINVALGEYVPDFRWPRRGLIIEADGAGTHENDLARHDDAVRTERLPDRVLRVSWRQAVLEPAKTVARLRAEELRSRVPAARTNGNVIMHGRDAPP